MTQYNVELYVYDLSRGLAPMLSEQILGLKLQGIWHTSIVIYETEYYFSSGGILSSPPGSTTLGAPLRKILLGQTEVPHSVFSDYIHTLGASSYAGSTYNLFHHNCNNFSEEVAQFLVGASIPDYILKLPDEILKSHVSPLLVNFFEGLQARIVTDGQQSATQRRDQSPEYDQLNSQIEEARYNTFLLDQRRKYLKDKIQRKEKKREKKRKKYSQEPLDGEETSMAEVEAVNGTEENHRLVEDRNFEEEERKEEEEKKKSREPPIVYKDTIDVKNEFDVLIGLVDNKLTPDEQRCVEELSQYMLGDEGSWALSDGFLTFVGRVLEDKQLDSEIRVRLLKILAAAALKDDVILLLHQDRKDHVLMNYAFSIDRVSLDEQRATALFVANMFENLSSSEWLLYISEWSLNNQQISNIRVTTKVAVHSLLSEDSELQDRGAAIVHNLACKEVKSVVFDDVAVELTMALLQYFNSHPAEEQMYRCLKALAKFTQISNQEVPQLIQMIGPDPKGFKGMSPRVDELIAQIGVKLR